MEEVRKYLVQYTHQKQKKQKLWSEGFIKVNGRKVHLYEEDTNKNIDSKFIHASTIFEEDTEIETDGYLIRITSGLITDKSNSSSSSTSNNNNSIKNNISNSNKNNNNNITKKIVTTKSKTFSVPVKSNDITFDNYDNNNNTYKNQLLQQQQQQLEEEASCYKQPQARVPPKPIVQQHSQSTTNNQPIPSIIKPIIAKPPPLLKQQPQNTPPIQQQIQEQQQKNTLQQQNTTQPPTQQTKSQPQVQQPTEIPKKKGFLSILATIDDTFFSDEDQELTTYENIESNNNSSLNNVYNEEQNISPKQHNNSKINNDNNIFQQIQYQDVDINEHSINKNDNNQSIIGADDDFDMFFDDFEDDNVNSNINNGKKPQLEQPRPHAIQQKQQEESLITKNSNIVPKISEKRKKWNALHTPSLNNNTSSNNNDRNTYSKSIKNSRFSTPSNAIQKKIHWNHDEIIFPDAKSSEILYTNGMERNCPIPNSFDSAGSYQKYYIEAIQEDLNIKLMEISHNFYQSCINLNNSSNNPKCKHGPTMRLVTKKGQNKGKEYFKCAAKRGNACNFFRFLEESEIKNQPIIDNTAVSFSQNQLTPQTESLFQNRGISLYTDAHLYIKEENNINYNNNNNSSNSNSQNNNMNDNNNFQQNEKQPPKLIYLLKFQKRKDDYAKDDIWILSTTNNFTNSSLLFRSVSHGPSQSGIIELKPISELPPNMSSKKVIAIRGLNASTELSMIDNLRSTSIDTMPIGSFVMNPTVEITSNQDTYDKFYINITNKEALEIANEYIDKYELNEHQSRVLLDCLAWFNFSDSESENFTPPVTLVHGVFGSGKSTLLVVIILFIDHLCEVGENDLIRIMVSSLTNVAVDRVLLGLIQYGFNNFNRIGSIKKIAKPILLYLLRNRKVGGGGGGGFGGSIDLDAEMIHDLKSLLKTHNLSDDEKSVITDTIKQIENGTFVGGSKKDDIKKSRVVGVTCNSSLFSSLNDCEFPILFLDECSQMQEPLSLLPIFRSKCHKLLTVGDPMQLEPTIQAKPSKSLIDSGGGLEKTLFVRLSAQNVKPTILRIQYRCHPMISQLSNQLFYGGMLNDGILPEHRGPLVSNLKPIVFVEAEGGMEQLNNFGSYYNEKEIEIVMQLIDLLKRNNIQEKQIGIICLYKAQAEKLTLLYKEQLEKRKQLNQKQKLKQPSLQFQTNSRNSSRNSEDDLFDDLYNNNGNESGVVPTTHQKYSHLFDEFLEEDEINSDDDEAEEENGNDSRKKDEEIKISTVDAFQGAERDIIILSCSRTSSAGGFIDNHQRLNVAITRAKNHFIIVGKSNALASNETWKTIIKFATSKVSGKSLLQKNFLF